MQGAWERLTKQFEAQARDVETLLSNMYTDPRRKYHNLHHIKDCLTELEELRVHCFLSDSDIDEITIAVWFHDAIYDPKAHNNEEESARLFEQLSEGSMIDLASRERIRRMILATKDHCPLCDSSLQECVMLDLDLSILGKSDSEFDEYDRAIRMEYEWVPEALYRDRRVTILGNFLERDRIYRTDYIHNKYDQSCRSNLKRAVARLLQAPPPTHQQP